MDVFTHALAGTILANLLPNLDIGQKVAIVTASVLPDIPFSRAYFLIAKEAKKSVFRLKSNDFTVYGPVVKSRMKLYLFFHSLAWLGVLVVLGFFLNNIFFYLFFGWGLHIVYDLFLHRYEKKELRPQPLYPLKYFWSIGLGNGWNLKTKHFLLIWANHLFLVLFLIIF